MHLNDDFYRSPIRLTSASHSSFAKELKSQEMQRLLKNSHLFRGFLCHVTLWHHWSVRAQWGRGWDELRITLTPKPNVQHPPTAEITFIH